MKIMIVDDEKPIRQWFTQVLAHLPQVEVVGQYANGQAALEALTQSPPDLLITDIIMPVMDGLALIRNVQKLFPNVKILILSNYGDYDYVHEGMKLGVKDYLLKAQCDDGDILRLVKAIQDELEQDTLHEKVSSLVAECLDGVAEDAMRLPQRESREYSLLKDQLRTTLSSLRAQETSVVSRLIRYMQEHYSDPLTLSAVAEEFGYHADYLSMLLKQQTGMGFHRSLTCLRMKAAAELLKQGDKRVREVALAVGYSNEVYFSTAFKNYYGVSPRQFLQHSR